MDNYDGKEGIKTFNTNYYEAKQKIRILVGLAKYTSIQEELYDIILNLAENIDAMKNENDQRINSEYQNIWSDIGKRLSGLVNVFDEIDD